MSAVEGTMPADRGMSPGLLQQLRDHLLTVHHAGSSCLEADSASLNRQHWEAHSSELTSFLDAHPVQV